MKEKVKLPLPSDPVLGSLVLAYDAAKDAEEDRFKTTLPRVHISPWNPRSTQRWGHERYEQVRAHLKAWTVEWWKERGYTVFFGEDDAFGVEPIAEAAAVAA